VNGTPKGDWTSVGLVSDGSYGIPAGLIAGFPARSVNGAWEIVQGLEIGDFARGRIDASVAELVGERDAVSELGLI
jgi:malate dehydrogenase